MKIVRILLSRFRKTKNQKWQDERLEKCLSCPYNSNNNKKITLLKRLSDMYSYITFKSEQDNKGNCVACDCSVYFKAKELDYENCPKGYWEEIDKKWK